MWGRGQTQGSRPHPPALLCPQWEPACQTPQPSARAHSAPGSGTTSRPGSIRRKLQPSGESLGSGPGCPYLNGLFLFFPFFKFIKLLQNLFHNLPWPWEVARADSAGSSPLLAGLLT